MPRTTVALPLVGRGPRSPGAAATPRRRRRPARPESTGSPARPPRPRRTTSTSRSATPTPPPRWSRRPTPAPLCLRSAVNYPALVAEAMPGTALTDVSCSGAATEQHDDARRRGMTRVPCRRSSTRSAAAPTWSPSASAATTTASSRPARQCTQLRPSDPTGTPCADGARGAGRPALDRIGSNLADGGRGRTRAVAAGPHPGGRLPADRPGPGTCADLPLADGDYAFARQVNQGLTDAVEDAADEAGVEYVDVWAPSAGHDICADDPWINGRVTSAAGARLPPVGRGAAPSPTWSSISRRRSRRPVRRAASYRVRDSEAPTRSSRPPSTTIPAETEEPVSCGRTPERAALLVVVDTVVVAVGVTALVGIQDPEGAVEGVHHRNRQRGRLGGGAQLTTTALSRLPWSMLVGCAPWSLSSHAPTARADRQQPGHARPVGDLLAVSSPFTLTVWSSTVSPS